MIPKSASCLCYDAIGCSKSYPAGGNISAERRAGSRLILGYGAVGLPAISAGSGGADADVTSIRSSDPSIIVDPGMASALLSGRKTQVRVGMRSALAQSGPGDRLWVRESCIAGRREAGQDLATALSKAEFAIFTDGWRRYRDGSGKPGRRPGDGDYEWIGATHMPRWASRITLVVEWTRAERLQQITRADIRAEGALPILGGLLWRWPRPIPGKSLTARRAFAANWNVNHPTPGDRWEDNPPVIVLGFRVQSSGEE